MPVNGNTTAFAPLENEPDPVDDEEDPKKKLMEEDMAYLEAEKCMLLFVNDCFDCLK